MLYNINIYKTINEDYPFNDWLDEIDQQNRACIKVRLKRVEQGNFNNCKPVRCEIYEVVIDIGPGFRIYYANVENSILILFGGTKRTQKKI